MAKTKRKVTRKVRPAAPNEVDTVFLLKMIVYVIIGSAWVRITKGSVEFPVPIGFLIGILIAMHERFQIDRKIEYALLLMVMFLGFWLPIGIRIAI